MVAPESESAARAVSPTVVPTEALSATVLAEASESERVGGLSSTLVTLMVKVSETVPPSEDVALTVMLCDVAVS